LTEDSSQVKLSMNSLFLGQYGINKSNNENITVR